MPVNHVPNEADERPMSGRIRRQLLRERPLVVCRSQQQRRFPHPHQAVRPAMRVFSTGDGPDDRPNTRATTNLLRVASQVAVALVPNRGAV